MQMGVLDYLHVGTFEESIWEITAVLLQTKTGYFRHSVYICIKKI